MQETETQFLSVSMEDLLKDGMATHSSNFGTTQKETAGYTLQGHEESDTTEAT